MVRVLAEGVGRLGAMLAAALAGIGYWLYSHPPYATVSRNETLVRENVFDGSIAAYSAGTVLVISALH
jgi:hypothetical protein